MGSNSPRDYGQCIEKESHPSVEHFGRLLVGWLGALGGGMGFVHFGLVLMGQRCGFGFQLAVVSVGKAVYGRREYYVCACMCMQGHHAGGVESRGVFGGRGGFEWSGLGQWL